MGVIVNIMLKEEEGIYFPGQEVSGKVCVFSLYIFKFLGSKAGVVNLLKVFRKLNGCYMSCWKFFLFPLLERKGKEEGNKVQS